MRLLPFFVALAAIQVAAAQTPATAAATPPANGYVAVRRFSNWRDAFAAGAIKSAPPGFETPAPPPPPETLEKNAKVEAAKDALATAEKKLDAATDKTDQVSGKAGANTAAAEKHAEATDKTGGSASDKIQSAEKAAGTDAAGAADTATSAVAAKVDAAKDGADAAKATPGSVGKPDSTEAAAAQSDAIKGVVDAKAEVTKADAEAKGAGNAAAGGADGAAADGKDAAAAAAPKKKGEVKITVYKTLDEALEAGAIPVPNSRQPVRRRMLM